jgi:glycosyltransferase involved in cell wall biosynthesis
MPYLPAHVEAMASWMDQVEEIIVVDSESTDGTVEYLRERLKHSRVHFHPHPRGLYQSWNYGIRQISSKYTYISTTGDTITLAGLKHLVEVAETLKADVVISPPEFKAVGQMDFGPTTWPVHELINGLQLKSPVILDKCRLFCSAYLFAARRGLSGITGSAASDLFLTSALQQRPFPTDCGTVGDTFWGLHNSVHLSFAITPQKHSTFLFHPKTYDSNTQESNLKLIERAGCDGKSMFNEHFKPRLAKDHTAERHMIFDLFSAIEREANYSRTLDVVREKNALWVINPAAWKLRYARNFYRNHVKKISELISIDAPYFPSRLDKIKFARLTGPQDSKTGAA